MSRADDIRKQQGEMRRLRSGYRRTLAERQKSLRSTPYVQPHEVERGLAEARTQYEKDARAAAGDAVAAAKAAIRDLGLEIEKERVANVKAKDPGQVMALVADWTAQVDAPAYAEDRVAAARRVLIEARASGDSDVIRAARTALTRTLERDSRSTNRQTALRARDLQRELRDLSANPKLAALEAEHAEAHREARILLQEIEDVRQVVAESKLHDQMEWTRVADTPATPPAELSAYEQTRRSLDSPQSGLAAILRRGQEVVADRKAAAAAAEGGE